MDKEKAIRIADIVINEYKNINQQAIEEYKQKFWEDIEKLKKERETNGKSNTLE